MNCMQCHKEKGTVWYQVRNVYFRLCKACLLFAEQWARRKRED